MAGCNSILQVNKQSYRQSLKGVMTLVILINVALFVFFLITEYRTLTEFNYSITPFKWYQFFITFLLASVSILALRAIMNQQPFMLLIFTKSNVFLIFLSSSVLIFLSFFQPQVIEYLAQQDHRTHSLSRSQKSLVEKNFDVMIYQELMRIGWEFISFLVAINYYRSMLEKRTLSIIYTIPQQFITWQDETLTSDRSKSISTSLSQYKTPLYARLI